MKLEERDKLKSNIREKYKKSYNFRVFGVGIGAGISAYFSAIKGNDLYTGVGGGLGILAGEVFGLLYRIKLSTYEKLVSVEEKIDLIIGLLSILMAIAGITAFFLTGDWSGIVATIFFGSGGIYLILQPFETNENLINGLLGIIFGFTGLFAFIQTGNWIHLIAVIFFGLGGMFLIFSDRSR